MKNIYNIIRILGIATCLIGAYLMAFGEPIIGVDHAGIATVIGILGIGLITTGNTVSLVGNKKEEQ
jgi:O-antigen/teichoic acid export membrane protein